MFLIKANSQAYDKYTQVNVCTFKVCNDCDYMHKIIKNMSDNTATTVCDNINNKNISYGIYSQVEDIVIHYVCRYCKQECMTSREITVCHKCEQRY